MTLRALSLVGALVLGGPLAWAEGEVSPLAETQARLHFRQGKAAFELGNFGEALEQYKVAYRIAPLPGFLFNIGQCHRNLGNLKEAVFTFRLYLKKQPEAQNREAVRALIKELQGKIRKQEAQEAQRRRAAFLLEQPPAGTQPPAPPRPPSRPTPFYKSWWFWTLVTAAAGGAATGVYFGTRTREAQIPDSQLGTWDVRRTH